MTNIYISNNKDLFNIEIPNFDKEIKQETLLSSNIQSHIDNKVSKENFFSFSIIVFFTLLVILIFVFLKKLSSDNNEYIKKSKNYKEFQNKKDNNLKTPNNITICIKEFLERTK